MLRDQFRIEHLVCEVPASEAPAPGYSWYEIDWEAGENEIRSFPRPEGSHVIAATRRSSSVVIDRLSEIEGEFPLTHVQFEAAEDNGAVDVRRVWEAGLSPIVARHLSSPPESERALQAVVEKLAGNGPSLVKVVFPCVESVHMHWLTSLLQSWDHGRVGLSLTPRGGRQMRLAAALAGSRLVYAPTRNTRDRMSALWWRELLQHDDCLAMDPGVHTW